MNEEVQKIIKACGGCSAVAKRVGVSRQAVWKWKKIPAEYCYALASMQDEFDVLAMRPDVFLEAA